MFEYYIMHCITVNYCMRVNKTVTWKSALENNILLNRCISLRKFYYNFSKTHHSFPMTLTKRRNLLTMFLVPAEGADLFMPGGGTTPPQAIPLSPFSCTSRCHTRSCFPRGMPYFHDWFPPVLSLVSLGSVLGRFLQK